MQGFGFGVKLVRGAYIHSDPRHLIHDTKSETDAAYDEAASMLATHHITNPRGPKISTILATHNRNSIERMRDIRQKQLHDKLPLGDVAYAQLMGMADELSLSLTQPREVSSVPWILSYMFKTSLRPLYFNNSSFLSQNTIEEDIKIFKYTVWGTTEECMMYLLRRADENRDAIDRSSGSRRALWRELWARVLIYVKGR